MFRFELPFTESSLLLSPRFGDYSGFVQVLFIVACFTPVALVGWLYRYELRLVRRSVAGILLGLRLLVITFVIVLIAFQPVVARTSAEKVPGRVLVALDRSDSMGVADPQRPVYEKLRLARALRLVRDLCSDADLDGWIEQAGRSGQPQWPLGRTDDDRRRRFDEVCQRVDGLTRSQIARAVLTADGTALLAAIDRSNRVDLFGFAAAANDLDPAGLGKLPPLADGGSTTDLRVPLARGAEAGSDGAKPVAVVVLTDGQHNETASPVEKAIALGRAGVPVYPVAIGTKVPPTDIVLTTVQAPATVFKGSDASVEARVEVRGLSARTIEVELQRKDYPPMVESINHDGTNRGYSVRFNPRLGEVGTQVLTVHARSAPEETRTENNTRAVAVNVADDRARVLLVDGEARWEHHYLAAALARDRGIELATVLFDQPRIGRISQVQLRAAGHPEWTLPSGPDALDRFDCIVLGDVSPEQLSLDEQARLERFVGERGGTLIVLAGRRAMPLAHLGDSGEPEPLRKLLPIEAAREVAVPSGFAVTLTAEGKDAAFLRLESTAEESERRWAALPRQFWGAVGTVKPAATVLASVRPDGAPANDLAGWDRNHALIARHNYGFGRVLYVGLDSTWRWRYRTGDTYHHRFWGQVVRWAASDAPLLAGNEFVRFGPRAPVVPQGQDVAIGVRLAEKAGPLPPGATPAVRLVRLRDGQPEEPAGRFDLRPVQARSRELEAKLRDLPPGRYAVELAIPGMDEQLRGPDGGPLRGTFAVSPRPTTELVELALNLPLLEEIASKTGGRVFTAENAAELADLLGRTTAEREAHAETKLWQAWPTLVIFLALLSIEWLGRKWAGLP